jgi:hypothetical protein
LAEVGDGGNGLTLTQKFALIVWVSLLAFAIAVMGFDWALFGNASKGAAIGAIGATVATVPMRRK